jgi:osmotically-inducible protein OsmY
MLFFSGGKMKNKFLAVLCLSAAAGLVGCGGSDNTNTANTNANANMGNTATAMTPAAPVRDATVEAAVKDALTKKGFNDVTVEATASEVTLRGTVPKDKMTEAVQAAQEVAKRKVVNQLTKK